MRGILRAYERKLKPEDFIDPVIFTVNKAIYEIIKENLERLLQKFDFEGATVYFYNKTKISGREEEFLVASNALNLKDRDLGSFLEKDLRLSLTEKSLAVRSFTENKFLISLSVEKDPYFQKEFLQKTMVEKKKLGRMVKELPSYELRNVVALPLFIAEKKIGLLQLVNSKTLEFLLRKVRMLFGNEKDEEKRRIALQKLDIGKMDLEVKGDSLSLSEEDIDFATRVLRDKVREFYEKKGLFKEIEEILNAIYLYNLFQDVAYRGLEIIERKDKYTKQHSEHVAEYNVLITSFLEDNGFERVREIYKGKFLTREVVVALASLFHDIGKIEDEISESILNKKGKLSDEEYKTMKRHTGYSRERIREVFDLNPVFREKFEKKFQNALEEAILFHHKRYDLKGYPENQDVKKLPFMAGLLYMGDFFDALTTPRVYKEAVSFHRVWHMIEEGKGTEFDPLFVNRSIRALLKKQFVTIKAKKIYKKIIELITTEIFFEEIRAEIDELLAGFFFYKGWERTGEGIENWKRLKRVLWFFIDDKKLRKIKENYENVSERKEFFGLIKRSLFVYFFIEDCLDYIKTLEGEKGELWKSMERVIFSERILRALERFYEKFEDYIHSYHGENHVLEVVIGTFLMDRAFEFERKYGSNDLELMIIFSIYHDIGYVNYREIGRYEKIKIPYYELDKHEERGVEYLREDADYIGLNKKELDFAEEVIIASKVFSKEKNLEIAQSLNRKNFEIYLVKIADVLSQSSWRDYFSQINFINLYRTLCGKQSGALDENDKNEIRKIVEQTPEFIENNILVFIPFLENYKEKTKYYKYIDKMISDLRKNYEKSKIREEREKLLSF